VHATTEQLTHLHHLSSLRIFHALLKIKHVVVVSLGVLHSSEPQPTWPAVRHPTKFNLNNYQHIINCKLTMLEEAILRIHYTSLYVTSPSSSCLVPEEFIPYEMQKTYFYEQSK
jgi:hypothetical protein